MSHRLNNAARAIETTQMELSKLLSDARMQSTPESKESKQAERERLRSSLAHTVNGKNSLPRTSSNQDLGDHPSIMEYENKIKQAEEYIKRLESENVQCQNTRNEAIAALAKLEQENDTLRSLVQESMQNIEQQKQKLQQSEIFAQSLNGLTKDPLKLLQASQPPPNFVALKVTPEHETELEITKCKLKKAESEIDRLISKLEAVSDKLVQTKTTRIRRMQDAEQLVRVKHQQLLGAVRRIDYLVEKNESFESELKKKDAYIRKLESVLLEQHRTLNSLPQAEPSQTRTKKYSKEIDETIVQSANWDSIFKQCSLDKRPNSVASLSSKDTTTPSRHRREDDDQQLDWRPNTTVDRSPDSVLSAATSPGFVEADTLEHIDPIDLES